MRTLSAWFILLSHLSPAILAPGGRALVWRLPLLIAVWGVTGLLFLAHAIGLALDDLLFRRYRKIAVLAPVFIVGVPRSGTTHLQRQLTQDPGFTSLTLWECLLAPSITERYIWAGLGRCWSSLRRSLSAFWRCCLPPLRRYCSPLHRYLSPSHRLVPRWRWSAMDAVHYLGWREAEEDFLLLLYRGGCFLPALLRPDSDRYWDLAFLDEAVPPQRRRHLMRFYHACVQRHLFYHGTHRRLLSKNPSWTGWVETLADTFPGARFIACVRRPNEAVPSQLSALRPMLGWFGQGLSETALQARLMAVLHSYYRRVALWRQASASQSVAILPLPKLAKLDTAGWQRLYAFLGQPLPYAAVRGHQERRDSASGHRYRLEDFGLTPALVEHQFADVWPGSLGGSS